MNKADSETLSAKIITAGRADKILSELSGFSRTQAKRMILNGLVFQDQTVISAADELVKIGAILSWRELEAVPLNVVPEPIALEILYEDEDLLVVEKPAFMCVHPAPGQWHGTLVNALLHHCGASLSGIGGVIRPGIVHRIDKDTSGILVVAKNDFAHQHLSKQFFEHSIERVYDAFVKNIPDNYGQLEGYIGRHSVNRQKMSLLDAKRGKYAKMEYWLVTRYHQSARVKCKLYTGRTHQIRVQMAAANYPLIGDKIYGGNKKLDKIEFARQALHAGYLGFTHPRNGKKLAFESPLPDDMQKLQTALENLACETKS